jgi:hypothetical protein
MQMISLPDRQAGFSRDRWEHLQESMVWNMTFMTFHSVGNGTIIPTDSSFSRWLKHVKTTNQIYSFLVFP